MALKKWNPKSPTVGGWFSLATKMKSNLDLKLGAYILVKKQTKGAKSKVCCLAHDSVTNDLVKKQIGIGLSESRAETEE